MLRTIQPLRLYSSIVKKAYTPYKKAATYKSSAVAAKTVAASGSPTASTPAATSDVSDLPLDGTPERPGFEPMTISEYFPNNLGDAPQDVTNSGINWAQSYHGLGFQAFDTRISDILCAEISIEDVEIKPDGILYLPEIKYRRILNRSFGPGGWGLVPRSETIVTPTLITREYALVAQGRMVGMARGEQNYFKEDGIPTATEGCKSNALMRCCKDLGIASELWDPVFIRDFKKKYCVEKFVEHVTTKRKKKMWFRKDRDVEYPWK